MHNLQRSIHTQRVETKSPMRQAAEAALLYVLLCTTYILGSGYLATRIVETPQQLYVIETFKGIVFIVVSGAFFFGVSCLRYRTIRRQNEMINAQEKTLLQAEKRLVAAMAAASVAHDLNNLLMVLYGFVEEIRVRERSDPSLCVMREDITVSIDKLAHLAKRLASGVSHAMPEKDEPVDLKAALAELAAIMQKHPEVRFCRLTLPDVAPLSLVLNRTLFEEAVVNLLINAAQAAGPKGQIEVRLTSEPGSALLAVDDSGPGVADQLAKEIFEPFFTTKPEGTGIGLMAVMAFVSSCGAKVSVGRSHLGGAAFQIRIPIPCACASDSPHQESRQ